MQSLRLIMAAGFAAVLASTALPACAQNDAPFTIRRPPDGATVREKVRVEIPLASIPEGGYVAFSIDGQFRVALTPSAEDRAKEEKLAEKEHRAPMYIFVWDTKAPVMFRGKEEAPKDGDHEISATLFVPKAGGAAGSTASQAKQTSSVKLKVANKVGTDPGPISLRYKFIDGMNRQYLRSGESAIVTGLSQGYQGTGDQELVAMKGKLQTAVEDKYSDGSAMVRNKLTELIVRQNGQESVYPTEQLPKSLYQQLDEVGRVLYQNEDRSFDQFAQLGVPVNTTIDLPRLPLQPVRIGDKWVSRDVTLDIPGTAPENQPKVDLKSTLEDIEWEGGYPTARVHQTYNSGTDGGAKPKAITFGTIEVLNPTLNYERDIYIAYRSGTLIRVTRKLEVTGKTTSPGGGGNGPSMGGGGMVGGGEGIPGGFGPQSAGGAAGMAGPGLPGDLGIGGGAAGRGRGARRGGGGFPAPGGGGGFPAPGGGGGFPAPGGGRRGGMGSSMGPATAGGAGMAGAGSSGMAGPARGGFGGGFAGGSGSQPNAQITLKSTVTTELDRTGTKTAGL